MPESPPVDLNEFFEPILRRVAMFAAAIVAIALGWSEQTLLAFVLIAGAVVMWLFWRAEKAQPQCSHCKRLLTP
jgi:hypothetical protein